MTATNVSITETRADVTIEDTYAVIDVIEPEPFTVTAVYAGLEDPTTPTGGGVQTSTHQFTTASNLWIVNHSLGNPRPPLIVEDDILGNMLADIDYVNANTIHVHHSIARTGVVYLTG